MHKLTNREEEILIYLYAVACPSATAMEVYQEAKNGSNSPYRSNVAKYLNSLVNKGYAEKKTINKNIILFEPIISKDEYRKEKIKNLCSGLFKNIDELKEFLNEGKVT